MPAVERLCLHLWRRRQSWWSTTRSRYVSGCSQCRRRWAADRGIRIPLKGVE